MLGGQVLLLWVKGDTRPLQGTHRTLQTLPGGAGDVQIAAENHDPLMTVLHQVGGGTVRTGDIVAPDIREIGEVILRSGLGDKDAGNVDMGKALAEVAGGAAQEDQGKGLAFTAELQGVLDLVGTLIHIVDQDGIAPLLEANLHLLQNAGEEHVEHTLDGTIDDNGDAVAGGLLQVACVVVGHEVMRLKDGLNLLPRLRTDVRAVVQNTRDGGNGVTGFPCDVFDCHGYRLPFQRGAKRRYALCMSRSILRDAAPPILSDYYTTTLSQIQEI